MRFQAKTHVGMRLLTTRQVAVQLNVSPKYVRNLARKGLLKSFRLRSPDAAGRRPPYRFSEESVRDYLGETRRPSIRPADVECERETALARGRRANRRLVRRGRQKSADTSGPCRLTHAP